MDRLIDIKINGSHLSKDNLYAGVQGENNATAMRIEFDESWDGYAKTVVFWNARGENPVKRTLTADLLEDITQSSRIYICMIPGEPLEEAGECTIIIDGYAEGKRPRSVPAQLKVRPAPDSGRAGEPVDPTPTQAEQLQKQIDGLMGNIQAQAIIAHDAATVAGGHAQAAATSEGNAQQAAADAQAARAGAEAAQQAAAGSVAQAAAQALNAQTSAQAAANAATAAASGAQQAEASAAAAKKSETAADAYATGAHLSAETATDRASDAQAAAVRAESAQDAVQANATAAQKAQKAAETAQAAAENASHAALEEAKRELSGYVNDGKSSAAAAQAAKTAAESSASRASAIAQAVEGYVDQAENAAQAAGASAQQAANSAGAAKTSETAAATSATGAYQSAEAATDRALEAEAAAVRAENARDGVESAEQNAASSANAAAASATAAQTAESNAKAAQKAAEDARDAASEIAGGDFASKGEAKGYADTAEANANKYTDRKIEAIPTPDVSGQIGSHDADAGAHMDIRQALDGAVKKTGDTMGWLDVTTLGFIDERVGVQMGPDGASARLRIIVVDKVAGGDCVFEIMPGGLHFTGTDYIERTVIHTGNLAQYMGVAQASLEE